MSTRVKARRTCVAITLALFAILFVAVPSWSSTPSAGANDGAQAQDPGPASNEPFADGTVLVGYTDGTSTSEKQNIEGAVGATDVAEIGAGTHVLHVPNGQVKAKIDALKAHGRVRYAEPDYVVRADVTPDDQSYKQLWGMKTIQADQAWNVTTGSQSVVVGDVDTGLDYTHPDLAANVWSNNGAINGCAAGTHGYNALTLTCDPMDDNTASHGTHTAGTIGAVGNNNLGVVGVNWAVSIMGLKFLDSGGSGSISGAIAAIDWAVKAKIAGVNVRVLNNSWGGGGYSQALRDEIAKAGGYDILFVAAAGNYASNDDTTPLYPCSYNEANEICVAATGKTDSLASFSNYGANSVDLSAPGVSILSTLRGGTYGTLSGTSMATPHVSGAAALALSTGYQSVGTLKATILAAVDPVASQAGLTTTGGRLDLCKALPACSGVAPPPPLPPPPPPAIGDFSLAASPGRHAVPPGGATSYVVTVTPSGGFTGLVWLTVNGLPTGGSGSFAPTPLDVTSSTSSSSTLAVTTSPTTSPGNYTLTIAGASGSLTHATTVVLRVKRR